MITNIWVHPHPADAPVISGLGVNFTAVSISIHRDRGTPVTRVVHKDISDKAMATILRGMADELVEGE